MAKSMDARQKLERIRNLKDGKLEVKKLGAITLTKKTGGKIMLTTNKGEAAAARAAPAEVSFGRSELWIQIHWNCTQIQNFGPIWIQGYAINFERKNLKIVLKKNNFLYKSIFFKNKL